MSPYSFPDRTYTSYEHGAWRYPSGAWYVERDLDADGGQCPDIGGYSDGLAYQDGAWYLDNGQLAEGSPYRDHHQHQDDKYPNQHRKPRRRVRQTRRSSHSERPHKDPPFSAHDECSRSSVDEEPEHITTNSTQKENIAPLEEANEEARIEALAEEKFIKKCAEEEQRIADAKEKEEKWLIERKEIEELHKAEQDKALADQRAAIMKEAEDKENAIKAELERQTQAKIAEQELIERTEAAVREADRKAAADKMQADQERADAEREEAARREAQAKEDAEKLYAERLEKEANERRAAEKDIAEKESAEKMDKILVLVGQLITEDDLMEKTPSKKAILKNVLTENSSKTITSSKRKGVPAGYNESVMAELKKLVPQVTKGQDLGEEAAFQEEKADCSTNNETGSSSAEASGCASGSGSSDGQTKEAEAIKDEERDGGSARTAKRLKSHGEHRDGASKKSRTNKRRKAALDAMKWFAGKAYLSS